MTVQSPAATSTSPLSSAPVSPVAVQHPLTTSPQLVAMRARISAEWRDLVYREALRMTGALRQILAQSNNSSRNQLTKKFLGLFNNLLGELRKPNGLSGTDSDLHGLSTNFEGLLQPWIVIFQSDDLTGPFIHSALISIRSFLHSGMFTDQNSPFSRSFIHDLVFSLAHSRFEPTVLENDEIVMLELIEFLAELVQVTVAATKSSNYSGNLIQNEEIIGETFLFQLFDLLFALLNQNRFSELLRAKAVEIVVEQCSLIFSSLKKISGWKKTGAPEERQTKIHFPNIVKPQKPVTPKFKESKSLSSPVQSESVVSVNISETITAITEDSSNMNTVTISATTDSHHTTNAKDYNPFTDENENELAPDAIEEVMKFRAKIAGISLNSSEESSSGVEDEEVVDFFADRLSSHCLKEILSFLIRCIDIIDAPGKKPPGSIKAEPAASTASTKVIPSIKTQTTAMKCLVAIFTDPISELSRKKSPQNVTEFETEIIELIGGDLLKQLLAILSLDTTSKHLSSLSQLLLVIFTNYRTFLPAQFEYFISTCLGIILTKPSAGNASGSSGNVVKFIPRPALTALKTSCLEMLAYFLQDPSFIAQIFVYYECSLDYQNTLELLTKGIAAGMEKSAGNEEVINLSGEILCNFIKTIEASLSKVHSKSEIEDLKELLDQRRIKMIYSEAAGLFNSNPKEALPFLQQKQLLSAQATPKEIAAFLRRAQGLDKKILGEYLVKPNHIEILREFFSAFKFSESTTIDSALRQVLESFRLPGEAQQIDRIMECFSEIYYPSAKATFSSQDACYVLAFSTLMLNTDLHNPQVKHKMSLPDFIRNNRGINDGKDVDEEYLTQLYNSIKTREIVMPEEHGGEEAFASQWNEVQKRRSSLKGKVIEFEEVALSPLVCGIVEIVWKPIILSLIPYINQQRPTGEVISDGPLEALRGIASLFEKFQMTDALDALLGNIWSVSNLIPVFSAASGNMIPRYLARLPGFRQVVQLIVDIFRGQGDGLKSSWTNWCRLLIMLSESGLIGTEAVITQEAILFDCKNEAVSLMALMKMAHEGRQVQPVSKQGFLSRFFGNSDTNASTSVTTTTAPVINDEITMSARQFVGQLPILEILINTIPKIKSKDSFSACIESLCTHLKWNLAAGASNGKRISQASTIGLNWTEETLILLTESLVSIGLAVEAARLKEQVFNLVFDTFTRLVLQDSIPPVKLCEHVVIGLGRLLLRLSESGQLENEKFVAYLKFWCQLSPQLQGFTLEPFLALIALTFSKIKCQSPEIWPPMFTILSTASKIEASAPYTLKLLQLISDCSVEKFPVDFFTEFIDLLSVTIVGCTVNNYEMRVFDPWRNGKEVTRGQVAEESLKLYEKVFNLFNSVGSFESWKNFLVPLESNLSRHAPLHPIKSIRQQSINLLARLLPQTRNFQENESAVAPIIFSKILIPLLVDLRLRQEECDEIVTRCASLTCKTFLLHLDDLGMPKGQLWKEVLEAMLPLVLAGQPSEMVKEGVLESCKNVLLVMHSSEGANDSDVWRVSDVMLGPLIPGWKMEIEMRVSGGAIIDNVEISESVSDVVVDSEHVTSEAKTFDTETITNEHTTVEPTADEPFTEATADESYTINTTVESYNNNNHHTQDIYTTITQDINTTEAQVINTTEALINNEPFINTTEHLINNEPLINTDTFAPIEQTFSPILRSPVNQSEDDIMAAFAQPDTFISLDEEENSEKQRNDIGISSAFDVY